jgi:hypothetical protein
LSTVEADVELPALSVQLPVICAPERSGPVYVRLLHEASPEVASAAVQLAPTGWLYQPL